MRYKKYNYILVLILMLLIGINRTYASNELDVMESRDTIMVQSIQNTNKVAYRNHIQLAAIKKDECVGLFGDKKNPESISYLIHQVLDIPKYVVPILIIVLGTLDFAKAALAGKEDEMRKSQSTFIKRVLIGIVIFFIPMILDLIMYFADFVIEGTMCTI